MILKLAASLALAAATNVAAAGVPGLYVTHQMEIGGALELGADGRFRYQLDYGAVSEGAEGKWAERNGAVELTSEPMPRAPDFTLVRDDAAPPGELYVTMEKGELNWSPLDVLVDVEGASEPAFVQAEEDGRVRIPAGARARSVRLLVPVYGIAGSAVPLSGSGGHRMLFRFDANDLGKAGFKAERLVRKGDTLVMDRYGAKIIFHRADQGE
jgi:hypothetical protein